MSNERERPVCADCGREWVDRPQAPWAVAYVGIAPPMFFCPPCWEPRAPEVKP